MVNIIEKKGFINHLKRRFVKDCKYKSAITSLYFGCSNIGCKRCFAKNIECYESGVKRRTIAVRWLEKNGYKVDFSKSLKRVEFGKKYLFVGKNVADYINQDYGRNDFVSIERELFHNHEDRRYFNNIEGKIFISITNLRERSDVFQITMNGKVMNQWVSQSDIEESFFMFMEEIKKSVQEELDV